MAMGYNHLLMIHFQKYYYNNGAEFEGEWCNDQFHGEGRLVYENGDMYKGYFQQHIRHGYGISINYSILQVFISLRKVKYMRVSFRMIREKEEAC